MGKKNKKVKKEVLGVRYFYSLQIKCNGLITHILIAPNIEKLNKELVRFVEKNWNFYVPDECIKSYKTDEKKIKAFFNSNHYNQTYMIMKIDG